MPDSRETEYLEQQIRDQPELLKTFQDALRRQPELLEAFLADIRQQPDSFKEFMADICQQPDVLYSIKEEILSAEYQARLADEVAFDPNYRFTFDFVSPVAGSWQEMLSPFRETDHVSMLEIGSFEGRSAVWFLENILTDPTDKLVCIDPFALNEALFDHNIDVSGFSNKVTKLKGPSAALVPTLPLSSFDLIYVDGDHHAPNVFMDGILCWDRLKPDGIMIFDDYLWKTDLPVEDRPQIAVDLCLNHFDGEYDLLLKDYQVVIRKRPRERAWGAPLISPEGNAV